ncbi:MAG TPA: bifunctional [glutamate--ammonia ligase]-adenylyl-L-tyrosine phosphorylase/[glutamate--ammonia-ligase] adenylyltransferase [Verrucomicrobiae bacterium]
MPKPAWEKLLLECADPPRARRYWEALLASPAGTTLRRMSVEQCRIIISLFSASEHLGSLLVAHPEWMLHALKADLLKNPRQPEGLRRDVSSWLDDALRHKQYDHAFQQLRLFKQRESIRIAARDLSRLGSTMEIVRELSDLADICLEVVQRLVQQQLTARLGNPWHQNSNGSWEPTEFCILGLGKLGGQELNYSSDVDLIFLYAEEGFLFPARPRKSETGKGISNHQFFTRLAKEFITHVSQLADEGALYRVDVRLRPEGDAGPLVRSLQSYENYYAQWGQIWERMMLLKARPVAGSAALGAEFLEMIQPFRYPRSLNLRILNEVAATKDRIETEVVRSGELDRNVKLGRGGIREIEFIVQTHQVLQGGRNPFLHGAQTIPALKNLVRYRLIPPQEAEQLTAAYCFLRDVEHRLQMENNLQTHTIPAGRKPRERLAALMGFEKLQEFEDALVTHTTNVRLIFEHTLRSESETAPAAIPDDLESNPAVWKRILEARSFRDVDHALQLLTMFVHGPGYVHVSPRTVELALGLVPHLLRYCPLKPGHASPFPPPPEGKTLSDPDRVLARLDSFIQAYGARMMLYETWTHNPSLFELLLLLFDRSEFLAEVAIRTPDLVEDLQLSGRLRRSKTADETLNDLRYGLNDPDQLLWMRRYHQAEQMRLGLRDILGLVDFEHNLTELSALADACLRYALEAVQMRNRLEQPPFTIIALGKLGGSEINYGSDLDIIFIANDKPDDLPRLQKYAVELMELLSKHTDYGIVFQTDARLRPDGEKGLLVNTLEAYDEYFRQRAQLWEIQSFTRTRIIAGDSTVGEAFQRTASAWTDFSQAAPPVAAYARDWRQQIVRMRARIEKERTPTDSEHLAIKTGAGGLMDAEFLAQIFVLENGWQEPNTLKALLRAQSEEKLPGDKASALITHYRRLRRIEGILRRWSFAGETELPDDPAALHRVAIRCGFENADEFAKAVSVSRQNIRAIYLELTREQN